MSEDLNVGKWEMLWQALKAPKSGDQLLKYVKSNVKTKADMDYVRDVAIDIGSDPWTAQKGRPGPFSLIDNFFGRRGSYKGQNLGDARTEGLNPNKLTSWGINEAYKRQGIEPAPDLLSVFLDKKTHKSEGLKTTSQRPSKGYPFAGGDKSNVYDVTPYAKFKSFKGKENNLNKLYSDIENLKPGESINMANRKGIEIDMPMSIDLGEINYSVGKTKKGDPYLALADVWDFGGKKGQGYGDLMDHIGGEAINFYGRFPIGEKNYTIDNSKSYGEDVLRSLGLFSDK